MKILVVGGAGYIGSALCEYLTRNPSYQVRCVDNFMWKQHLSVVGLLNRKNFELTRMDARELTGSDLNVNIVINLAAIVGAPLCDKYPQEAKSINYDLVMSILDKTSKNTKIIFPNTNSSYGSVEGICTEETPFNPLSIYAKTKSDAEKAVLDRGNSVSFRLATVFGVSPRPRMDLMVNNFVGRLYFDGNMTIFEPHARRNFVGINDVCRAFAHAFDIEGVYNLGLDSANCTKLELAEQVKKIVNPNAVIKTGNGADPDQRDYNVSSDKLTKTGFQFTQTLESGITDVWKSCNLIGKDVMTYCNY